MNKYLLLALVALLSTSVYAQKKGNPNSPECQNKWGSDSTETAKQLSLFNQYYQEKKYVEAYPFWKYLFENAPCIQQRITYAGPFIIKRKLKEAVSARRPESKEERAKLKELKEAGNQENYDAYKEIRKANIAAHDAEIDAYAEEVFAAYRKRIEFWGREGYVLGQLADDMSKLTSDRRIEAIGIFDSSMMIEGNKTKYGVPKDYIYAGVKAYKDEQMGMDSLFRMLDVVTPIIDHNMNLYRAPTMEDVLVGQTKKTIKKFFGKPDTTMTTTVEGVALEQQVFGLGSVYFSDGKVVAAQPLSEGELIKKESQEGGPSEKELILGAQWKQTQDAIIGMMRPYLSCDKLTELKQPVYEANKANTTWLKSTVKLLDRGGCESTEFYLQCSEALFAIEPTSDAALSLAKAFSKQGDDVKAVTYYTKAADLAPTDEGKYTIWIKLAKTAKNNKQYSTVRDYARKALAINPNSGEAYILIGDAYAASATSCGTGDLGRGGVYLVAVDKYAKAKSVDPSVAEDAQAKINKYAAYFPVKSEAFFKGINTGDSYRVGCWIGESTTVRTIEG